MNPNIFKTLVSFPLFIGMGTEELKEIVAKTKFSFHTLRDGEKIVDTETRSGMLAMLTDGTAVATTLSDDKGYWMEEDINGPMLVQPEYAFGLAQHFTQCWKAKTVCHLITIDKQEILKLSDKSLIFRLNLLNLLSTQVQKRQAALWRAAPHADEDFVRRFLLVHSIRPAGRKVLHIKVSRLEKELHIERRRISAILRQWEQQGLIYWTRGRLVIPALEKLLNPA
jgi:CRP-like cAMP-binding protein